jgi:hypothetical protein
MRSLALSCFHSDAEALLVCLIRHLCSDDLSVIAQADFAQEATEHLDALQEIARLEWDPSRLDYYPREVLELTSYGQPDPAWSPEVFRAAHRRRAFATCALLRAYGEPDIRLGSSSYHLLQLIRSLRQGALALDREAGACLTWLIPRLPPADLHEHAYFGLGLLWFALAPSAEANDHAVRTLIDWIMDREDAYANRWRDDYGANPNGPWLLHAEPHANRRQDWREVGEWMVSRSEARCASIREAVQLLVSAMDE